MSDPDLMTDAEWWAHLHATATWVYRCHANVLCGVECTLFVDCRDQPAPEACQVRESRPCSGEVT